MVPRIWHENSKQAGSSVQDNTYGEVTTKKGCQQYSEYTQNECIRQFTDPKVACGSGKVMRGAPEASAVFTKTVLPHHWLILFLPIVPFAGYCRQKKITTALTATPESRAADRTSRVHQHQRGE